MIGCAWYYIRNLENNIKVQRKQYGLKYHVTGNIHSDMSDKLSSVSWYISLHNQDNDLWDKGQNY